MRDFIFLCIGLHQQSAISSSVGCRQWRQAAESASWLRNDLNIPRAPENMCIKISYFFFSIFGRNITLSLEYLGPVAVFQQKDWSMGGSANIVT